MHVCSPSILKIPISEHRSDAIDNILGALIIAGTIPIPEVTLYFHEKLLRGNRALKCNADGLEAFDSLNIPPLAKAGVRIAGERCLQSVVIYEMEF